MYSIVLLFFLCDFIHSVTCASFVKRTGSKLYLDGNEFRAVGTNIYWLGLDENVPPGTVAYPTEFRITDALTTAKDMGATVIRAHTLGVSTGNSLSFEPKLDEFNVDATKTMDFAIATAGKLGLKLIIPLTDQYRYYHGGFWNFASWYGKDPSLFYTDQTVTAAFKRYIQTLITRTNPLTGLTLVNDTTILAWESGNELSPPPEWTSDIAQYVKSIDPNHLFLDGTYGIDTGALEIPEVDIYSNHYYPMDGDAIVDDYQQVSISGKVFFAGEFGWVEGDLNSFLESCEQHNINYCYWSLFPHNDDQGFVQHSDGQTLHWPGDTNDMLQRALRLRQSAYKIRNETAPVFFIPPQPLITSFSQSDTQVKIGWRGSSGAVKYSVQALKGSTWQTVCDQCANDNQTPITLNLDKSYVSFKVQGFNLDNKPGPFSNPVPLRETRP